MSEIYNVESISQLHQMLGIGKPKHPLISIIWHSPNMAEQVGDVRFSMNLYVLSLKERISGSFKYGRSSYDFEEGTLVFIAPGQVLSNPNEDEKEVHLEARQSRVLN